MVQLREIKKYFPLQRSHGFFRAESREVVHAVDGVNLDIHPGETVGLVGESGCGKSTLGRTALLLYPPTSGQVIYDGKDITSAGQEELRRLRGEMQIIFQDPYASLNPRRTVEQIVGLPLLLHGTSPTAVRSRVKTLLRKVGLQASHIDRFPHQFSGGQRQRIGVARALALRPRFIVADEPVSSLDVSIQAQIINLLEDLKNDLGLTFLFITHDLSVVSYVSDRIAVMYLGKIVEIGPTESLFDDPRHPYTKALLSAIPQVERQKRGQIILPGSVPSPVNPPEGCRFRTRCYLAEKNERCLIEPELRRVGKKHHAACHYASEWKDVPLETAEAVMEGESVGRTYPETPA